MLLLKISGLLILLFCSVTIGFIKSEQLILRKNKLNNFCKGFTILKERIRYGEGEIEPLILKSFEENLFYSKGNTIKVNKDYLQNYEITLIEEYLDIAGMSDPNSEFEKCKMYHHLLNEQYKKAETECTSLCKLYKTVGLLGGIFICIFFL